ncbi:hypothetical protein [Bradyrhizobium liaoningense]|uniref:hypothetical protein n=1 Tax=Bradyrhizobium liaoningense TaxID=43992 RepID=UPI001BA645A8|nr:hypothetical protein [Bradyrhizobium liaoningense]MBR0712694.1 hypothetical protein [Bradyrhizobium liaoningense]
MNLTYSDKKAFGEIANVMRERGGERSYFLPSMLISANSLLRYQFPGGLKEFDAWLIEQCGAGTVERTMNLATGRAVYSLNRSPINALQLAP